jgi:hypothetical protein
MPFSREEEKVDLKKTLRAAKQRRYREHFKLGFRSIRFASDPTVVADFLREHGVTVPDRDPQALGTSRPPRRGRLGEPIQCDQSV